MVDRKEKRGLGRGLSALMADVDLQGSDRGGERQKRAEPEQSLPIEQVVPNPDQPRRDFDEDALQELTKSISEKGIIQPLIVRPINGGSYQIVAGERRWRAAQRARLHEVPVVVREFTDTEVLEIAIIENVQRADLNPVEEALGYRQLQDRFGHTQEQLSKALGKSRSHIANLIRLLNLPDTVLAWLREDKLSAGHARALITAEDPVALAKIVISKRLSVRETEKLAKSGQAPTKQAQSSAPAGKDADTRALEQDLSAALGMRVQINHTANGESGSLAVSYKNFEQLDELCRKLSQTNTG